MLIALGDFLGEKRFPPIVITQDLLPRRECFKKALTLMGKKIGNHENMPGE